ncbi:MULTISPECIES: hypothetical protein [unclassified Aureispira]|uniref:hypothetical protein n=1 Tax=unclassified Aureispira TaxID=2649989 RepID=UPI00069862ED|nr:MULTISPECIES: hypothetical protein [unclassified Aureispira]WMX12439.1 hypothetical protein QP953_16545 [Aureispira sp. CCB-E]
MKKFVQSPFLLGLLFVCTLLFSSFSVEYSKVDSRDDNPPVTQKENRRKHRLEKRQARLQKRLKKSKNTVKRQRIQKKIRGIQKQKDDGFGSPALGIVGMVLSILSFILFVAFIASLLSAAVAGIAIGITSLGLLLGGLGLAIIGLTISIISLILNAKNPDKFTMRGFGLAGMIVGSIMTGIFIVAAVVFFAFM